MVCNDPRTFAARIHTRSIACFPVSQNIVVLLCYGMILECDGLYPYNKRSSGHDAGCSQNVDQLGYSSQLEYRAIYRVQSYSTTYQYLYSSDVRGDIDRRSISHGIPGGVCPYMCLSLVQCAQCMTHER